MKLVERHIIKHSHRFYSEIDRLCFASKNLYNCANYLIRQSFIFEKTYLNYNTIQKTVQGTEPYQALPAKVSQQILMILDKNWKSFQAANQSYYQNPEKFLGKPKLPKYKHKEKGRNVVVYTTRALSKRSLKQRIIHPSKTDIYLKTKVEIDKIKQVRLIPKLNHYVIEVIYETVIQQQQLNPEAIGSIDIGLDNLATLTFNQAGLSPLLVNGRPLKSINQYYNKTRSYYQSLLPENTSSHRLRKLANQRDFKINDYLHKASHLIINTLINYQIETLVIGRNQQWKQQVKLGKKNNQNFVQIPHSRFIDMLTYKAELVGIKVVLTEESYTSKASFLDGDEIPVYQKEDKGEKPVFQGKRVKRGLYRTQGGNLIQADVNGSLNIMRKAIPNAFC
ncbi:MAG: RNA-guided endonuclease InsQ/TnpB family protein [Microcystaceae cyanobacterium]